MSSRTNNILEFRDRHTNLWTFPNVDEFGRMYASSGSTTLPSYSFQQDPNTGMYNHATNEIGFVTNGITRWTIRNNGNFLPHSDNSFNIGSLSLKPSNIFSMMYTFDSGVSITSGAGVPTSTPPNGSLYLRNDGSFGTTYYVREGGIWVPK